jgi:hypothetical protein
MSTTYTLLARGVTFDDLNDAIAAATIPAGVHYNAYDDADYVDDYYEFSKYPVGVTFWSSPVDPAAEVAAGLAVVANLPEGSTLFVENMQRVVS